MLAEIAPTEESEKSTHQFLTFMLAEEEYGIEILKVQEIKSWGPYTPVPKSFSHVLGVINLRGSIVPIIDLRVRLGLPTVEFTSTSAIIIVEVEYENLMRTIGLVVDSVSDVYQLRTEDIQLASEVDSAVGPEGFVEAFGHADEKLIILLNLDPIVSSVLSVASAETL